MKIGKGQIQEFFLDGSAGIKCPPGLIPAPGQYLLAHAGALDIPFAGDSPLPVPLFFSDSAPNGFIAASDFPFSWRPGTALNLRGPIGHGFTLPSSARKAALIAFDDSPARLRGLISIALKQNAEVALVCDSTAKDLPEVVEIQPFEAMLEIIQWADYAAIDVRRENVNQLREMFGESGQVKARREAAALSLSKGQVLVRAPMPCGALAECGVCALRFRHEWKMICKEGPVFAMKDLL